MNCKYSKREDEDSIGRHYLFCKLLNERCPIVRYCSKVGDIINTDNYDKNCKTYIDKESNIGKTNKLPNKILREKHGNLYIETNDKDIEAIVLPNPYDYIPTFVKLAKKQNGEYYIKK